MRNAKSWLVLVRYHWSRACFQTLIVPGCLREMAVDIFRNTFIQCDFALERQTAVGKVLFQDCRTLAIEKNTGKIW